MENNMIDIDLDNPINVHFFIGYLEESLKMNSQPELYTEILLFILKSMKRDLKHG